MTGDLLLGVIGSLSGCTGDGFLLRNVVVTIIKPRNLNYRQEGINYLE